MNGCVIYHYQVTVYATFGWICSEHVENGELADLAAGEADKGGNGCDNGCRHFWPLVRGGMKSESTKDGAFHFIS